MNKQAFEIKAMIDGEEKIIKADSWYRLKKVLNELSDDFGAFSGRIGEIIIKEIED